MLQTFLVTKNVNDNKWGWFHDFPSKVHELTVQTLFVEEHFGVSESLLNRKNYCLKGLGVSKCFMPKRIMSRFSVRLFGLLILKKFAQTFCAMFQKTSCCKNVYR